MKYFNTLIRVCKSIQGLERGEFWNITIVQETIKASSKDEAKKIVLEKYPQFFQNGKVYSRETKDESQFFYVLLYEYTGYNLIEGEKEWTCDFCNKKHPNSLETEHLKQKDRKFEDKVFCKAPNAKYDNIDDIELIKLPSCLDWYKEKFYRENNIEENEHYIKANSNYYIYKITEKETWKSYIGQTRNEPFFRWWQHLTHSSSPFWLYLRKTSLNQWLFEVLDILEHKTAYEEVLSLESKYIRQYDTIENGFNSVISKKR